MKVTWTRPALRDIGGVQDYISQDSPRAAYEVTNSLINRTKALLTENPMAGRNGRARGTRELVFSDLPYIITYRMTDRIEILAVVHAARDWPSSFN